MVTILAIDDEIALLSVLVDLFESVGFQVLFADRGLEGIRLAQDFQPNLIICDMMMPGISGIEVYYSLQENKNTAHIPFMFLTAASANEIPKHIRCLFKPFSVEDLLQMVNQILLK